MSYVSCMYAPFVPEIDTAREAGSYRIICTDEQGREWHLTEDSDIGAWLEFKANGGTVDPYIEPVPEAEPDIEPGIEEDDNDGQG